MRLLSKYYWFVFLSGLFAFDTLVGNSYYLAIPVCENDEQWLQRIAFYCMSKSVTGSIVYFYFAWVGNKPKPKMDGLDRALAALCGVVSVYSGVRVLFGALFISDIWYWGLFLPFYLILWFLRINKA